MSESTRLLEVHTAASRYHVHIGHAVIRRIGDVLERAALRRRIHLVADQTVWGMHSEVVTAALIEAGVGFRLSLLRPGEQTKTLAGATGVLNDLAAAHHERNDAIVALGGGVTTDLAGFAAAIWLRGVPWVCCPTSLECAIDAGIGGKTALNLPAGKNLIGAFHQPIAVLVDLDFLRSLPSRDYIAALAESVKHGIVADPSFLAWQLNHAPSILAREPATLAQLIETNVAIKAGFVAADERETSTHGVGRAALNLGHTIGHALEATPGQDLRHGEAVALGLRAALSLATKVLQFPIDDHCSAVALLDRFGLPQKAPSPFDLDDILRRMRLDKKARDGHVRFVLPRRLGQFEWWISDNSDPIKRVLSDINPASA